MEPFSSQRTFRNPGDVRGLPGVRKRTPIPLRECPLEGTKVMLCPKDEHLKELVTGRAIDVILPSRAANILGVLAMAAAVGFNVFFWMDRAFWGFVAARRGIWIIILGLAVVHVLTIFSQILSSGRNRLGSLAILVLYVAALLGLIIDHLLA